MATADTVFISRDEIQTLGFAPDADTEKVCKAIVAFGAREAVLKDGAGECVIAHVGGIEHVPARVVETVVDTTAAGDSFSAAYIACRHRGLSPRESATLAHTLAAVVVTHKGAIMPREFTPDLFPDAQA
jgi:2-dehydro-3-deoxygluconokinase